MKRIVVLLLAVGVLSFTAIAQADLATDCPTLSVNGPAGFIAPGQSGTYTAQVDTNGKGLNLEYNWTISAGKILEGQGTETISFWQPANKTITATVEVKGFPEGCPSVASETMIYDPPPEATKIVEVQESEPLDDETLDKIIDILKDQPNNQLYVMTGFVNGRSNEIVRQKEEKINEYLVAKGIDRRQITLTRVTAERGLMQFWLVPPGAENPRCEECEKLDSSAIAQSCPTISVTGPAGITDPGDTMTFTAAIGDEVRHYKPEYRWKVSGGKIIKGHGTISVDVIQTTPGENVTATFEIVGLPKSCENTVSETAPVCTCVEPVLIDEFSTPIDRIEFGRLEDLVLELKKNPTNQALIIEYFPKNTFQINIKEKVEKTSEYLIRKKGLDKSQFEIVTALGEELSTKL